MKAAIERSNVGKKRKWSLFDIVLTMLIVILCLLILIPVYKVFVDSFDVQSAYGMRLFPKKFGLDGYISVFTNESLYRPLIVSVITTALGTLIGLTLATLGGYVLIQWDMPGRTFFANFLLFTMIFNGGMIPTYLVINKLNLTNTLWSVILMGSLNVYYLVLMRNFFEGVPKSLYDAAEIDGCSPIKIFFYIVLPLSKAALASIGLMYAVSFWNDYTNFKLYITDSSLYNFQMKLRSIILGSDLPSATGSATENTVKNAATVVAILPFTIIYPFAQKYFVTGINTGAVKG